MNKGEMTREMILDRAAELFNRKGYFGTSLSDLMEETGLEKGGIYNHFGSKEQLALEAFDHSFKQLQQHIRQKLAGKSHAVERLHALLDYFLELVEDPFIAGGCPILNTAIEADDAHPLLYKRAREAMDSLRSTFQRILARGIERQELRAGLDVEACTTIFISILEGAVLLSRLYKDSTHMRRARHHLIQYIEASLI